MNRGKLKKLAKDRLDGRVVLGFALILLTTFVYSVLSFIPFLGWMATLILSGPITLSMSWVFYKIVVKNKSPDIEDLMYGVMDDNFLRGLVGELLRSIFTLLWGLLLIIPGIIKGISYSQMYFVMIEHPEIDASVALKKSMKLMNGHKMDYFLLLLSFIPWYILVILTFGLFYIWVGPYVYATKVAFYKEISKPSTVIAETAKKQAKKVKADVEKAKKTVKKSVKKIEKEIKK